MQSDPQGETGGFNNQWGLCRVCIRNRQEPRHGQRCGKMNRRTLRTNDLSPQKNTHGNIWQTPTNVELLSAHPKHAGLQLPATAPVQVYSKEMAWSEKSAIYSSCKPTKYSKCNYQQPNIMAATFFSWSCKYLVTEPARMCEVSSHVMWGMINHTIFNQSLKQMQRREIRINRYNHGIAIYPSSMVPKFMVHLEKFPGWRADLEFLTGSIWNSHTTAYPLASWNPC